MDEKKLNGKHDGKRDREMADQKQISPMIVAAIAVALDAHFSDEDSLCSADFAVIS
ncbi:MAG: hypothetical protein QG578_1517 [Thermodesulfobacteriota bacterium]|nr:hypothetical protein [Thermodesulfobacteriota bacterium]